MLIILLYKMPDYSKGKIYKITGGGFTYIGSTTETLARRLGKHRSEKKNNPNYNTTSYPLLDFDDCIITLVEDVVCERKEQLHMRERFHIENTECVNKCIPLRTKKEYYEYNKDNIKELHKEYYEVNKDRIKETTKQYIENNIDHVLQMRKEYYDKNKESMTLKHREYCNKNKEKIAEISKRYREKNPEISKERSRLYREKNKEKISQKKKEQYLKKKLDLA